MGFDLGQRVADYEVVSVLGSGGMGRVYQVRNVISNRTEAMKVLFADLNEEPDLAARFRSEIRTLAGLHHPHIAQLHTALQNGNELLMIMEFVDGCTLHQLAQATPLSLEKVAFYIQQVLAALSYAHSHGVVHRDIKPANIMVTPQGVVKLTDFGIAKSKAKDELTRPGTTLGSLNYMSPEQALGSCTADERSDIYSVGITLYELLTGQLPFDDESAYVVLHRQLNELPRPPIEINPLISQPLNDLILKSLEKEPAKRFQSAAELSDCLREVSGIVGAKTVGSLALFAHRLAAGRAASGRTPRKSVRRTSTIQRPWMIPAAAAVCWGFVACAAVGMAHFAKSGAIAKTSHAIAQSTPLLPNSIPVAHSPLGAPPATGPAPASQSAAQARLPALPATVPAPQPAEVLVKSAPPVASPAAPKLSRAAYHPASKSESVEAEADAAAPETVARPVLSAATLSEVQGLRRQKDTLDARASVIRTKMARLRTQTMLDGHELNQGMADAYVNMNMALTAANMDLESGDIAAARGHMEGAASEVSQLEKLFNQ